MGAIYGPLNSGDASIFRPLSGEAFAVAAPLGVSALAAVGAAFASGGTLSTAQPAGVSAFARVGQAIVVSSSSPNPLIGLNTLISAGPIGLNTLLG